MATRMKPGKTRELKSISVKDFIEDYVYRIDLDADYQREKIWSKENQELLLDSIVENIDIPKIYLARIQDNENFDFECIDGKQRMTTLLSFFKPEPGTDNPLRVRIAGEYYTYNKLREDLPQIAAKIEDYELSFVIYPEIDEPLIREIFRRLQLGVRLNSGELLKTFMGRMRDFIYREMGKDAPFLKHTHLSEKRFSRQFTLAQICINSFSRNKTDRFVRARYDDLAEFFKDQYKVDHDDENLTRIRRVLKIMDKHFGERAGMISSRAVAVSAFLFVERLFIEKKKNLIPRFVGFYIKLLEEVKRNLELLSDFERPTNTTILEDFQKYISQASVEPYAIQRRDIFLERAFKYYLRSKTRGKIIGT